MNNRESRDVCSDCPFAKLRAEKTKTLMRAIREYDRLIIELPSEEPRLSDIDEAMIRGIVAQQTAQEGGDATSNIIQLVGSVEESTGTNTDYFARAIGFIGLEIRK